MLRLFAPLFLCLPANQQQFSQGLTHAQMIHQMPHFETVRAHYIPGILRKLGPDIEDLCYQRFFEKDAQFINRFMNTIAFRLAQLPEDERAESIESVQLCIPASEAEYYYIHGSGFKMPPHQLHINRNICWQQYHATINERIAHIQSKLKRSCRKY